MKLRTYNDSEMIGWDWSPHMQCISLQLSTQPFINKWFIFGCTTIWSCHAMIMFCCISLTSYSQLCKSQWPHLLTIKTSYSYGGKRRVKVSRKQIRIRESGRDKNRHEVSIKKRPQFQGMVRDEVVGLKIGTWGRYKMRRNNVLSD